MVMRQFALVIRQLALVAARGWEGGDNTDTLRDCGARTGRRVLVRRRRTTAHRSARSPSPSNGGRCSTPGA
ncbi:hypothetical protein B0H14DRAFT_2752362 [Mycena olivaceomarginata]|nr:hypothetical protein B0H14DRAFT_2752362 [Mycena olivaceomarginata]